MKFKSLILILTGIIIGTFLFEVLLRTLDYSYPAFNWPDKYRAYSRRPGASGLWMEEGNQLITINSAGYRDREHSKKKPESTYRIIILGDSMAEALQVPYENSFGAIIEKNLGTCQNIREKEIEVINMAVEGYGTAQEYLTLHHFGWEYSPDLVLLAISTFTDILNNSKVLDGEALRPYFYFENEALKLDDSFLASPEYQLRTRPLSILFYKAIEYSRFLQFLRHSKQSLFNKLKDRKNKKMVLDTPELKKDYLVFKEPRDLNWTKAWQVTEGLLLMMRDEIFSNKAKFLIVNMSAEIQVHPDAAKREKTKKILGVDNLFYPDERIKKFAQNNNMPVINLAPIFQEYADRDKVYFHGTEEFMGKGHWNKEGHQLGGDLVSNFLCGETMKPEPPLVANKTIKKNRPKILRK